MNSKNIVENRWFPLADLLVVVASILALEIMPGLGWVTLLLAVLPWGIRASAGRFPFHRTRYDWLILIFLITAGVGVWAAYDPEAAWMKFRLLIGAVLLFYALAGLPEENRWAIAGLACLVGAGSAVFFLLANDWQLHPAKLEILTQVGLWWMKVRPGLLAGVSLSDDFSIDTHGVIAITTPFLLATGLRVWNEKRAALGLWVIAWAAASGVAFLLTISRGASIALGIGMAAGGLWALVIWLGPIFPRQRWRLIWIGLGAGAVLLISMILFNRAGADFLLRALLDVYKYSGRYSIAIPTVYLIGDTPFTGGGLASFSGLYSTYILVIPFYSLSNSHNLFMDIGLEQGIIGLAAVLWIFIDSTRIILLSPRKTNQLLLQAAFSSLVIIFLHGLIYDVIYGQAGSPLLFALPGIACALTPERQQNKPPFRVKILRRIPRSIALAASALLVFVLVQSWSSLSAAWYANLGAVKMAKAELKDFPSGSWDTSRIEPNLGPAESSFRRALQLNPNQRTANYHLGRIALMRREFREAVFYLSRAHQVNPNHPGITKNLAYSYIWAGQYDLAMPLLKNIPAARAELAAYILWWPTIGREDMVENASHMLKLLNQSNER